MVILKAARAQAAINNHTSITDLDIAMAAELALPHRLQKGPFSESSVSALELQQRIDELHGKISEHGTFSSSDEELSDEEKKI